MVIMPVVPAVPSGAPETLARKGEIICVVYCSADNKVYLWNGTTWRSIATV